MNWQDVLKILTPRNFLEVLQEKVGGDVKGQSKKGGDNFQLTHPNGYVKVTRRGAGEYIVNINNQHFLNTYDLEQLKTKVEDLITGEMEKVAGSVTTTAPAHSKLFQPTYGGRKRGKKDDEED
tara:strand:+ start:320 stop:688 length:369 start_codon:yes stop_codon:yes gene_type:complete